MSASKIDSTALKYLSSYSDQVKSKVKLMLEQDTLGKFLLTKYPQTHEITNDKKLREFVMDLKNNYLKKSSPISKIIYDPKIHVVNNALGLHTFVSRVQGNKLKSKNEIRISEMFRRCPEVFLQMITVHELCHVRFKDHDKAFYKLCEHMLPDYHQFEFEMRLYLTQVEFRGEIYN
ncbi:YgjP-like metallopeptidase domain-containing protein [Moritella sp. Urea-trap-13]|uniref:YgjP-like metallopeptidase domain-containing protein n=1 Tax=Moritella sp. Urea-trap-13 TaxID=2058327 RepID=UPI000C32B278|nr:YgjP-like metallopeptidase domain-containing protein [Moritella sp. Urea-trap-13]PKH06753.1 metal-dependent hydrolase [Moritella sp. Urea-trap-13]